MPKEFSVDELMKKLMILQKIEEGQEQINSGKLVVFQKACCIRRIKNSVVELILC